LDFFRVLDPQAKASAPRPEKKTKEKKGSRKGRPWPLYDGAFIETPLPEALPSFVFGFAF
jgi:hypothetical protein